MAKVTCVVAQGVALGVFRGRLLMRSRAGLGDCPWEVARGLPGAALGGVLGVGPVKSIGGMARESVSLKDFLRPW